MHAVTCSSSPSTASGVVNDQIPSVPTVGSKLNFGCSGENQMRTSTCGSDGRWNPDPEDFMCPIVGELMCAIHMQLSLTTLCL